MVHSEKNITIMNTMDNPSGLVKSTFVSEGAVAKPVRVGSVITMLRRNTAAIMFRTNNQVFIYYT